MKVVLSYVKVLCSVYSENWSNLVYKYMYIYREIISSFDRCVGAWCRIPGFNTGSPAIHSFVFCVEYIVEVKRYSGLYWDGNVRIPRALVWVKINSLVYIFQNPLLWCIVLFLLLLFLFGVFVLLCWSNVAVDSFRHTKGESIPNSEVPTNYGYCRGIVNVVQEIPHWKNCPLSQTFFPIKCITNSNMAFQEAYLTYNSEMYQESFT